MLASIGAVSLRTSSTNQLPSSTTAMTAVSRKLPFDRCSLSALAQKMPEFRAYLTIGCAKLKA
jgi:hypothetical protein